MVAQDYFYRRRFVREPGLRHVFHDYGPALVWRDDEQLWGCDFAQEADEPIGRLEGLDPSGRPGAIVPARPECRYGRLWIWRSRPLAIFAMYGSDGTLAATRIDFATPLQEHGGALYQTDLYLDIFVAADGRTFVVDDEDELEQARAVGLVERDRYRLVREQQRELIALLETGGLNSWLGPRPPFDLARIPGYRASDGRYIQPGEPDGWPEGLA